ncbi:hypothetical protein DFH07DRAFT_277498 [Mycena maculata]|uniref:Uncharacterized protein n=1 Tax=Mycena maculata TaxID=230809 RepID=A0AAD7HMG7_9AGAR|nr:hypothetical protein DFH07DRAFT_277498 [Mycena maculata]
MELDSLPSPCTMSPTRAATFFPITDTNRQQPANVSAAPFTVFSLQRMMIASGDSCANLRIMKVEYFQRDGVLLHEYLVLSYADVDTPGVHSFMVVELGHKVETHTIAAPLDVDSSHTRTLPGQASAPQSVDPSGTRTTSAADDRILIPLRRDPLHIAKVEPGPSTLLATITPPAASSVSVSHILVLASVISQHAAYDLAESHCSYYGRAMFDVTRALMGCAEADVATAPAFRFMQSDALQWRPADTIADEVRSDFSAASVTEGYHATLVAFLQSVEEQKKINERPLREATRKLEEVAMARHAAELEVERLRELCKGGQGNAGMA